MKRLFACLAFAACAAHAQGEDPSVAAERARLHVKSGVRVDSVEGAAARAGVQEGDVILQIGNVPVSSAKQFVATVAKLDKSKSIAVLVRRGDSANYLVIRPSK